MGRSPRREILVGRASAVRDVLVVVIVVRVVALGRSFDIFQHHWATQCFVEQPIRLPHSCQCHLNKLFPLADFLLPENYAAAAVDAAAAHRRYPVISAIALERIALSVPEIVVSQGPAVTAVQPTKLDLNSIPAAAPDAAAEYLHPA